MSTARDVDSPYCSYLGEKNVVLGPGSEKYPPPPKKKKKREKRFKSETIVRNRSGVYDVFC